MSNHLSVKQTNSGLIVECIWCKIYLNALKNMYLSLNFVACGGLSSGAGASSCGVQTSVIVVARGLGE